MKNARVGRSEYVIESSEQGHSITIPKEALESYSDLKKISTVSFTLRMLLRKSPERKTHRSSTPQIFAFSRHSARLSRLLSEKKTFAAPRLMASRPRLPEPAKTSIHTNSPSIQGRSMLNTASFTLSLVGRTSSVLGDFKRRPFNSPAMILMQIL